MKSTFEDCGWEVTNTDVRIIYSINDEEQTEWDGVIHATYQGMVPLIVFIETKQVFTKTLYNDFLERLRFMETLLPTLETTSSVKYNHKRMTSRFRRFTRQGLDYHIIGIIGSPCIEESVMAKLNSSGGSYVSLDTDQYVATLRGDASLDFGRTK